MRFARTPFSASLLSLPLGNYAIIDEHVGLCCKYGLRGHWRQSRQAPQLSRLTSKPLLLTPFPGIGLGIVTALLARPATTVVAIAREPAIAGLESELAETPKGDGSTFHTFALDAATVPAPGELRDRFISKTGLTRVDILIANAGMATSMVPTLETTAEELQTHFAVNATAPLVLFQALWPLMKASPSPKLFNVSSSVGSIEISELPGGAYGPSKAALNWITRRLHAEHEKDGLVSVAVHPG